MRTSALVVILAIAPGESTTRTATSVAECRHLPAAPSNRAIANDNRSPAGTVRDGGLMVRLVARAVAWQPDGAKGCALSVNAFAEEGRATQIPGPLVRVRAGTEVRVSVRNALPKTLWVRGLQDRAPGILDSTEVLPGATHDFRFIANTPGARYYWAGRIDARVPVSDGDGQLLGALVVDPPREAGSKPVSDRVMVLTRWTPRGTPENRGSQLNAFNGRSWPNTERLTYTAGDSVFWHVINGSDVLHEMHLHGFFFRTDATGFAIDAAARAPRDGSGVMRVTYPLAAGQWVSVVWSPDRPGNWLFHCHLITHMSGAQRLDRMTETSAAANKRDHGTDASGNHAAHDMGGLVMALDVRPSRTGGASARNAAPAPRARELDLYANRRPARFGDEPGYGFVLQDGPVAPPADSILIPGSPLILTRGEPVRITVHNRLTIPISVHWHGIELDSYFDGVGGFSGEGRRVAPMIAPKDSFVVRFTPPRAGTFMYHVHGERGEELASGLYAPLIVLAPGATFDARTDRVFMLADGGPGGGKPVFVNGTSTPDSVPMVVGTTYRLRFITISSNDAYVSTMSGPGGPVSWRLLATDGYDESSARSILGPARYVAGPGRTRDLAFTPAAPGDYALEVVRSDGRVTTGPTTKVPIRVRAATSLSPGSP
jgi:manganese oxidase